MTDCEPDFDAAALESYLTDRLGGEVVDTAVLDDALNLMVAVRTAGEDRPYVLRRPKELRETDLFTDLDREYAVLDRLVDTAVPAPEPVLYCEDASILGKPFFLTTYLAGESIPMEDPLTDRFPTGRARRAVATGLVDTLAEVHALDPERFADVCDHQTSRDQVDRAVARLDGATAVTGRAVPELRDLADWLRANAPDDPLGTLVHGDYKPGNVLFEGGDPLTVSGVLDWETAMLGDPRTELGYFLLYWRDEGDPTPDLGPLAARHGDAPGMAGVRAIDEAGFYPFTTLPGSPTRRELIERYERRSGIACDDDRFYRAHAALMLATVWEDLHRRQVEADARSDYPPLSDYVARLGTLIAQGSR